MGCKALPCVRLFDEWDRECERERTVCTAVIARPAKRNDFPENICLIGVPFYLSGVAAFSLANCDRSRTRTWGGFGCGSSGLLYGSCTTTRTRGGVGIGAFL